MDYLHQPLAFKVAKTLRYMRLYGPRRTAVKIDSQLHMQRAPGRVLVRRRRRPGAHVGILGCGKFAYSTVAHFLVRNHGAVIRGAMDPHGERAESLARRFGAHYHTTDPDRVLADPDIDLVYVTSNHASHADYAVRALEAGKSVHVEKPHAVTDDQLRRLRDAAARNGGAVNLGFNRPGSEIGLRVAAALAGQDGPAMLNWFVAGHELEADHWYHREDEGGRVLGNLCHWTDFLLGLVPRDRRYPIAITPTRGRRHDSDIAVTYLFGDETIGAITFSAMGHAFEGVKERFSAQKGDVLLAVDDFRHLRVQTGRRVDTLRHRYREHGHEANVERSYAMVRGPGAPAPVWDPGALWETGNLFLRTRDALERDERVVVGADEATPGGG